MLDFYQNLPQRIDPIVFSIGFFSIRWYSIAYLAGFATVYGLLRYRLFRGEGERLISNDEFLISNQASNFNDSKLVQNLLLDWMTCAAIGLLFGGRLGYVLFYDPGYYFNNPLAIVSPYDFSAGNWTGIFGMSYFGGASGIILASWIFVLKNKIDFWAWADFVMPAVPAGYFFGRIGNFLNGELYGLATEKPWGMYFGSGSLVLRHPSQLYEAFFEGAVLFAILWLLRNKPGFEGKPLAIYLFFYGLFRLGIEFFRQSPPGEKILDGTFTLGQLFSLAFIAGGMILWSALSKRKEAL